MEEEKAAQISFHSIFGTYKEDLFILSQITNVATWFTREELGACFRQQGSVDGLTKFSLPEVIYYSKMSCANQTVCCQECIIRLLVPYFSGNRVHLFDADFFEHIEKKRIIGSVGKTLGQIINILTSTLEELHENLRKDNGKLAMSTTTWNDVKSLTLGTPGTPIKTSLIGMNVMFLGKKN